MLEDTKNIVESTLNYIKGEIFRSMSNENAIIYTTWIKDLLYDTLRQEKELELQSKNKGRTKEKNLLI